MKRLLCFILIFVFALTLSAFATEVSPVPEEPEVSAEPVEEIKELASTAKHAIVYETLSGQILFEKDIHTSVPMASLTKIMTTLLVLEHGSLDEMVTASESAYFDLDPDGSTQNIVAGEAMSVEDLLYCVMVSSANEACNILAEHVAGSVSAFVDMMNARAKELGCNDTNFVNTHGLHDDAHYSSAYDLLLITQEAMKHPEFMDYANETAKTIPPTNKYDKERTLFTTNHLLSKRKLSGYLYHLAQGIKTGHTSKAGYCLVSSATSNGLNLITVVLGCEKVGDTFMSFVETKELMEWAFDSFSYRVIIDTKKPIDNVNVLLGKDYSEVNVVPKNSITALIPKDLDIENDIERTVTLPENVTAPITKGQVIGEIKLSYKNTVYGTVPLIADIAIELSQEESFIEDVKDVTQQPWIKYTIIGVVVVIVLYVIGVLFYNSRRQSSRVRGNYRGNKRRRRY